MANHAILPGELDNVVDYYEPCPYCGEEVPIALDAEDHRFYRTEIIDLTRDLRIALGNPVWNAKYCKENV